MSNREGTDAESLKNVTDNISDVNHKDPHQRIVSKACINH